MCKLNNIQGPKIIGIPFDNLETQTPAALEESIIFDDEGLLRNSANGKDELVKLLMDELSEILL